MDSDECDSRFCVPVLRVADAADKAGRHGHAIATYESFLSTYPSGMKPSKVAAIMSVVGLFGPSISWVAAPIAGANMRRAHGESAGATSLSATDRLPSLQYRVTF